MGILCYRTGEIAQERIEKGLGAEDVEPLETMLREYEAMTESGVWECGYVHQKLLFNLAEAYEVAGRTDEAGETRRELQRSMPTTLDMLDRALGIPPKDKSH